MVTRLTGSGPTIIGFRPIIIGFKPAIPLALGLLLLGLEAYFCRPRPLDMVVVNHI